MAKSMFSSPYRYLSNLVVSPRNSHSDIPRRTFAEITSPMNKRKADDNEDDFVRQTKRRLIIPELAASRQHEEDNDSNSSPCAPSASLETKLNLDRSLMPPPATPQRKMGTLHSHRSGDVGKRDSQNWAPDDDDSISFVSTAMARRKIDPLDGDIMEAARRHAAAIELPANSGIWSQTERELFFHLAYRGFEPLLPQNWMIDFDTLPLSVFAHENSTDPALIQNIRDNQFRACHALHRLFEAGHDARDRSHVSPGVLREKVLERSVKRYLNWALTDVGLRPRSTMTYLPVHVVSAKLKGETTLQVLEEVANKLQRLSEKYQQTQNVHPSVETHTPSLEDAYETRVLDDDASTPTFIGLVIISAMIYVVTLSPFEASTTKTGSHQLGSPPLSDVLDRDSTASIQDRLRIIVDLDFSRMEQDVWNALGVAIVAMQIRQEALKVNKAGSHEGMGTMDWEGMSNTGLDEDWADMSSMSRLQLVDDDPDL